MELCHNEYIVQGGLNGANHIAFSLGSKEAVNTLTNCLVDNGYELLGGPRITGDGYYESCVKIIDGVVVELTI